MRRFDHASPQPGVMVVRGRSILEVLRKFHMKNRATTGGTTEHTREQPRTTENQQDKQNETDRRNDEDKQNQKHKRSTPARHQGKNQPNKPKERQEPPTSNNQTNKPKERQEPDQRHTTHETRKPASRHQPPSQVPQVPPPCGVNT